MPLRLILTLALLFLVLSGCSRQQGPAESPAAAATASAATQAGATKAERAVQGLWAYESLGREGSPFTQLRGYFVFKDGWFVQQSLNVGEPFDQQLAQAHAGPYRAYDDRIEMTARVGLVANPRRTPSIRSNPDSEHVVRPVRNGDAMDLRFGSGTIQKFTQVGPGEGRVYPLDRGALALVDGHFILVAESPDVIASGSGRFERNGTMLRLDAERWFTARDGKAVYARGPIEATFDERQLTLPDGIVFQVASER